MFHFTYFDYFVKNSDARRTERYRQEEYRDNYFFHDFVNRTVNKLPYN